MNKIIGYFICVIGITLALFSVISMFKVFTGAQEPVQLLSQLSFSMTTQMGPIAVDGSQTVKFVNLALHGVFMFFLLAAGMRVCGAGINFIKVDAIAEALKNAKIEDIKKL